MRQFVHFNQWAGWKMRIEKRCWLPRYFSPVGRVALAHRSPTTKKAQSTKRTRKSQSCGGNLRLNNTTQKHLCSFSTISFFESTRNVPDWPLGALPQPGWELLAGNRCRLAWNLSSSRGWIPSGLIKSCKQQGCFYGYARLNIFVYTHSYMYVYT